ncbi:MAG: Gfo/Idh/MocA family oxidoreductase [Planctomycetia bacterium]|nr:Gfo/Idh/MocA family oxidoreductase [Planctomycetia bacterium]
MKRRSFLQRTAAAALLGSVPVPLLAASKNPSEKLNIGLAGVGGMMGEFHLDGTKNENQIALCDVDERILDPVCARLPNAKRFLDWREMIDQLGNKLDGIVITTPDHTHAPIACTAMNKGIHCYCEKPLAHDVWQIRQMQKAAKENHLITQMGTQVHASSNYRRAVEIIHSGILGKIKDVQAWVGVVWGGKPAPRNKVDIPKGLHWDLWLGPAPVRSYHPCYLDGNPESYDALRSDIDVPKTCWLSGNWRSFWDFGSGGMGDMACHLLDLAFWALDLDYPKTIETTSPIRPNSDFAGRDLTTHYLFDTKNGPLSMSWYDGNARPKILNQYGLDRRKYGILFIGDTGALYVNYTEHFLIPNSKSAKFQSPKEKIPESPGHHAEWLTGIRSGKKTSCDFDYAGKLSEAVLLALASYRSGKNFDYDPNTMSVVNCPEADSFLRQSCRKGWEWE